MAGVKFFAQTAEVATGTALKTILQVVAAAQQRVLVREISISFKGTSNTATPIKCDVATQSTAGTMSALTLQKNNPGDDETLQTTAQHTATVEPTLTAVLMSEEVHPQGGYTWQAPFGGEFVIKGGGRLAIMTTAAADVNCVARMCCEE